MSTDTLKLPAAEEEPFEEEELIFTDPSAGTYPRTEYPDFDFTLLGVSDRPETGREVSASAKPELATLPQPQADTSLNK